MERPPSVMAARRGPTQLKPGRDPNALVASAVLMTGESAGRAKINQQAWQKRAWDMYRRVGALRFGVGWIANALSRVNLIAAELPDALGSEPTPLDLDKSPGKQPLADMVTGIAGGPGGQGQMLASLARHLTVAGVGYVVALAKKDHPEEPFERWLVLSYSCVKSNRQDQDGRQLLQYRAPETGDWTDVGPDDMLIKVWTHDPDEPWECDSPVRAIMDDLDQIVMLNKRVIADARSRLAGNGLLLLPTGIDFADGQPGVDGEGEGNSFVRNFVKVTQVPITDQDSPAATTPLVALMDGDYIDKVKWLTFWSALSENLSTLRQDAIKAVALGLDIPPETLLGMGQSNHWSAWQVAEEAITLHVEPLAELICNALTENYGRAALTAMRQDPNACIVWYDTSDLTTRPDRSGVAQSAWDNLLIKNDALLRELGLDEDDLLEWGSEEHKRRVLMKVADGAPNLAPQMLAALGLIPAEAADAAAAAAPAPAEGDSGTAPPPGTRDLPAEDEGDAIAAAALLAASDGLVLTALERAGSRLRGEAARGKAGGLSSVPCADPALLHTELSATAHASLDKLLEGAWARVPAVAARYGTTPEALTAALDGYTRALLAAGQPHSYERLAMALGVDDRQPATV